MYRRRPDSCLLARRLSVLSPEWGLRRGSSFRCSKQYQNAGTHAPPCPQSAGGWKDHHQRKTFRDKVSSSAGPACLDGSRRKPELATKRHKKHKEPLSIFCDFCASLWLSLLHTSTSLTSSASRLFSKATTSSCLNCGSFASTARKNRSRVAIAKFGTLKTG